jgi:ATP-binding cassette, subfamily C (CFTR/MRP), member 1
MEEFGSSSAEKFAEEDEDKPLKKDKASKDPKEPAVKLLLDEEREVGAVSWRVYGKYGSAMGGFVWVGLVAFLLCFTQAATVGNSMFLGYWSGSEIHGFQQGDYMGVYAALGVASAIFTVCSMLSSEISGLRLIQ